MTATDPKAEALFAASAVKQHQALLDTASGKGWRAVNAFDILLFVSLVAFWWTAANRSQALIICLIVIQAYLAISIQVHRRIQALLRLLDLMETRNR